MGSGYRERIESRSGGGGNRTHNSVFGGVQVSNLLPCLSAHPSVFHQFILKMIWGQ